jgi:hypothetical protein
MITLCRKGRFTTKSNEPPRRKCANLRQTRQARKICGGVLNQTLRISRKSKRRQEKRGEPPNFPEIMAKTAQILRNLNENLFDFFDFAVKKFCRSSLAPIPPQKTAL